MRIVKLKKIIEEIYGEVKIQLMYDEYNKHYYIRHQNKERLIIEAHYECNLKLALEIFEHFKLNLIAEKV